MRGFVWLLARTPLGFAAGLCWGLTWLWYTVVPIRKAVAVANYRRAFPGRAHDADLRRMMQGLLLGYFELFHELRRPGSIAVEYRGAAGLLAHLGRGQGAFLLAAHYGSWDLLGPMTNRDLRLLASTVVKVPRQKAAAEIIEQVRRAMTMELLPPRDCMAAIYEQIGQGRVIVMLLDQRHNRGIPVPFFGQPAWTSPAMAAAAAKTGAPVFTLHYYRTGTAAHVVDVGGPVSLSGDIPEDTARLQQVYEAEIRRRPHNWLWMHDRWRAP